MATPQPAVSAPAIPESALPGPFPVGAYAAQLKRRLLEFARVQLVGEVWGFRASRARVYFELRDPVARCPARCGCPTSRRWGIRLSDGVKVVVGGRMRLLRRQRLVLPAFTFTVSELRIAGEGDLLVELERLRQRLHADGLFEPQKRLSRPGIPRTIGVVTGESGKARDDILAGLERRGWAGRLIWAFAPVQDRQAAPRITAALRELAAIPEVDVVIVARGGGSLADLFAFCDEALCRTVALLRVPVISSVGHHTDRTLIDDVAAVCCSTPTHAAEAAVPVDCRAARESLNAAARRLHTHSRRAIAERARALERLAAAPGHVVARERRRLHQLARELRATAPAAPRRRTPARRRGDDRAHPAQGASGRHRARGPRARPAPPRPGPGRPRPGAHAGPRLRPGRGPRRPGPRVGRGRAGRP